MDETHSAELYRQEGSEFRSVRLTIRSDGSMRLDCFDMGEMVEQAWGHDDYEFWVDVPGSELQKLVFALLRDRYTGRVHAVDEFRAFCENESINHKWESWP